MTMTKQTRRSFLELSALGFVAATVPDALGQEKAQRKPPSGNSHISVWVTSDDQRYQAGPSLQWNKSSASAAAATDKIQISPEKKFQDILGFGGAFTDAACYTFNRLNPAAREELFHEMFHPSQMGLSMGRLPVGSSDYAAKVYSFDEGEPDPEMKRFSIAHDREYILPILRQARQVNPDLFLFSSPWSPPGWMKFNGSMLGGSMRNHYFSAYAQYYLRFLRAYAAEGVPIQALTSQNEVDTDQDGRMPACIWPQEYEITFIRDHLGPLLASSGVDTKIWTLDHNYNLWGRAICTLADEKLRKYSRAVAWHGYVGTPDMMSKVHDMYPDAEMHWTEGGPDYKDPNYLNDWCQWGSTFSDILRNWCRSITAWNLALDEVGRPNVGPFSCGGVVTIHSQTREVTRSGQYWAFAHYSRAFRRGARRIDSQSSATDLHHVSVENQGGEYALIISNPGQAKTVELTVGNNTASVPLKPNSLTTLAWR
jgi:glucosylceramidase